MLSNIVVFIFDFKLLFHRHQFWYNYYFSLLNEGPKWNHGVAVHYAKRSGKRQNFRVESWNSHRMFIKMPDDDCKKKFRLLGQTGGAAGPETCKKCHFWSHEKTRKNRKNRFKIGWNHKKEELGCFPNDFFGTRGHPWGGFAPLKKITSINSRQL